MAKEYKYKFTVIMAIYNVEQYLEEAIKSVINQNIGFKENVQLILVNDGSPDKSEKICKKYKKLFPKNIIYIKKENGGVSSARNLGLNYAEGEYVNFLDPDDTFRYNVLYEVNKFFKNNYQRINFVAIPLCFFEARKGMHAKYKYMGNKNRIIDLLREPHNFVLSSAATFYKNKEIKKYKFDESLFIAEDLDINVKFLLKNPYFGYVCERKVCYNYRQRFDNSSVTTSGFDIKKIKTIIKQYQKLKKYSSSKIFIKEILIYQLKNYIKGFNEEICKNKKEFNNIKRKFIEAIDYIGINYIINESKWNNTLTEKLLIINFYYSNPKLSIDKNANIFYKQENDKLYIQNLNDLWLYIKQTKMIEDEFYIDLMYYDLNVENLKLIIKDGNGNEIKPFFEKETNSPYDLKNEQTKVSKTRLCKYKIKLKNCKRLYFYFKTDQQEFRMNKIKFSDVTPFYLNYSRLRIFNDKHIIYFRKFRFFIKHKTQSVLKYNIGSFLRLYKRTGNFFVYRLFNKKNKKNVLIMDRPNVAKDNGEALFKYISTLPKQQQKNIYFVISKKSKDYKRLKKYGKIIKKNSFWHKLLFINSKLIISSHIHPLFYKAFLPEENKYYVDLLNYKLFWLQHGIIKDDISKTANKYTQNVEKFVVSTNYEYNEVNQEKYLYFEKEIILTGLPRYDYLENNPQNIITIIPTWRTYLSGPILVSGLHSKKLNIKNTEYYEIYKKLLNNKNLKKFLKKQNLKLNFVLHPGMSEYFEEFKELSQKNVNISLPENVNYSKIFSESKLLITDYSSVFFDFGYLKKPEIFFQFDKEKFFNNHYKKGYFSYEKDGFGDVLTTVEDVVKKIEYYIKNDFKIEDKYLKRINKTFVYIDKNNCERVYKEILKLNNK